MLKQLLEDHRLEILTKTDITASVLDRWIDDPQTMRNVDVETVYPVMQIIGVKPDEFLKYIFDISE